jgi:HEAT repeat protein
VFTLMCGSYSDVTVVHRGDGAQDTLDLSNRAAVTSKAWEILTAALETDGSRDQGMALRALAVTRSPRARALLNNVAANGSPPARLVTLWYLPGELADLPLMTRALQDSDLAVRQRGIDVLARVRDARSLPPLLNIVRGGDHDLASRAIASAGRLTPLSLSMLMECIDTCRDPVRARAALEVFVQLDPDLRSRTATVNLNTFRGLEAEPALVRALDDSNSDLRVAAAFTLARLGNPAGVDELIRVRSEGKPRNAFSKQRAAAALIVLGRQEYLPFLVTSLSDSDVQVGWDTAYAMRSFPHASMRQVLNATWHGTSEIRYGAFYALLGAGGSTDRAVLSEGLRDADANIRFIAAEARLALGSDRASLDTLERLALDHPGTRGRALSLLSTKGDRRRTAAVARALLPRSGEDLGMSSQIYDPESRLAAVSALETVRDRQAVPALATLFAMDPELNARVSSALAAIGDDAARRALVQAMGAADSGIRIAAAGGVIRAYER